MVRYFTTRQVGRILEVCPRTVSKLIDTGLLHGERLPDSADRRIDSTTLLAFLKTHRPDLPEHVVKQRILFVGLSDDLRTALVTSLEKLALFWVSPTCSDSFAAGVTLAEIKPQCIILDFASLETPPRYLADTLTSHHSIISIALVPRDKMKTIDETDFTDVFQYSFDPALVARRVCRLLRANQLHSVGF